MNQSEKLIQHTLNFQLTSKAYLIFLGERIIPKVFYLTKKSFSVSFKQKIICVVGQHNFNFCENYPFSEKCLFPEMLLNLQIWLIWICSSNSALSRLISSSSSLSLVVSGWHLKCRSVHHFIFWVESSTLSFAFKNDEAFWTCTNFINGRFDEKDYYKR